MSDLVYDPLPTVVRWHVDGVLHAAMYWQVAPWDESEMVEVAW